MGKRLVYLLCLAVVVSLCAACWGQKRDFDIPVPDPIPVIDGKIDAVWSMASKQYMKTDTGEGPHTDDKDTSGYFRALHDSDYLYILIDVNDSELVRDTPLSDGWQDDSTEFYFDGNNSKTGQASIDADDFQYRFNWNYEAPDAYFWEYFHRPASLVGVEYVMAETATGYRFEVKFPWSTLMGAAGMPNGKLIGIDVYINDDDNGGGREHQVAWHSTTGGGWNTPSQWGTALVLPTAKASSPTPKNGAQDVQLPLLKWVAGAGVLFHTVYLGTTPDLQAPQIVAPRLPALAAMFYYAAGLKPGTTYYWRVDEIQKDNTTIVTGDVWTFTAQALNAYNPTPADQANGVSTAPTLTWLPGQGVSDHHLYFGDSLDAVTQGAAETDKGALDEPSFAPGALEGAKTYYWRVDETAPGGTIRTGDIWSFTTWLVIDNFESYNDEEGQGTRIYETWVDGFSDGLSGSTVGYLDPPICEPNIVHTGAQSMPLDYNNVNAPYFSEATLPLPEVQDWTAAGTDTLVLYLRGKIRNTPSPVYIVLKDRANKTAKVTHSDPEVVNALKWVEWKIPLSEFTAGGVDVTAVKSLTLGVGDRANTAPAGAGLLFVDDIVLITPAPAGE